MKIGAIIQARMGSRRLPGKVLSIVDGKPLLKYIIERLQHSLTCETIVVATSTDEIDSMIETFCSTYGINCYRGLLNNVASRFNEVLNIFRFDAFARVNGDSPLLDQKLLDKGVEILLKGNFEIVTNVLPRTYPPGQSVEIFLTDSFRQGYKIMQEDEDLEHVTKYFYKNRDKFRMFNFTSEESYGDVRLAIDTEQDIKIFRTIIAKMNKPHWQYGLREILKLYPNLGEESKNAI